MTKITYNEYDEYNITKSISLLTMTKMDKMSTMLYTLYNIVLIVRVVGFSDDQIREARGNGFCRSTSPRLDVSTKPINALRTFAQ